MKIDRKNLNALLGMNDRQLTVLINRLLTESGIDPAQFNIDPKNVASIRSAISSASDEDIAKIVEQYEANRAGKQSGGRI